MEYSNMADDDVKKTLDELKSKRKDALLGGGLKKIESQHQKNKLTARERLQKLFDSNTFNEIDQFAVHQSNDLGLDKQKFLGDS
ncbi:MAG: methylmalonyl-CoA carboxyltransferase, partial [SAR202 cluster bacterium]|nr:methylmalonyl-CoA carboxyltransferase [SAR202 cluster bacterium]